MDSTMEWGISWWKGKAEDEEEERTPKAETKVRSRLFASLHFVRSFALLRFASFTSFVRLLRFTSLHFVCFVRFVRCFLLLRCCVGGRRRQCFVRSFVCSVASFVVVANRCRCSFVCFSATSSFASFVRSLRCRVVVVGCRCCCCWFGHCPSPSLSSSSSSSSSSLLLLLLLRSFNRSFVRCGRCFASAIAFSVVVLGVTALTTTMAAAVVMLEAVRHNGSHASSNRFTRSDERYRDVDR